MRGLKHAHDAQTPHTRESHLLQMRGLKLKLMILMSMLISVASFTDAWIETFFDPFYVSDTKSHLLQMRGLKLVLKCPQNLK